MSLLNRIIKLTEAHYTRNSNITIATLSRINNYAHYHRVENYNDALVGYSEYLNRSMMQLRIAMYTCAIICTVGTIVILINL